MVTVFAYCLVDSVYSGFFRATGKSLSNMLNGAYNQRDFYDPVYWTNNVGPTQVNAVTVEPYNLRASTVESLLGTSLTVSLNFAVQNLKRKT